MHNFCLINIKRPVLSSVFSLLLVVFGLYTFFELSTRELPKNLQPPEVVISTKYTGASPSIIASEISEPIELAIGGAEGIKSIDTLSEIGRSTIKIEFFTSIDIDDAANDIRERIARIIDNLPEDSKAPEVRKASAGFSTSMWLSVSSTSWNSLDIGDYVKRNLVDAFSSVPGTGRVIVGGINEKAVRAYLNPVKLSANDLDIREVESSIRKNNVAVPAGTIEANNVDLTLFQSNLEGELVEKIQHSRSEQHGLIINAGGYTHTSVAIHDALKVLKIPIIELHISNIYNREEFRHKSLISKLSKGVICGFGSDGYIMALNAMNKFLEK